MDYRAKRIRSAPTSPIERPSDKDESDNRPRSITVDEGRDVFEYLPTEVHGVSPGDKSIIYDFVCKTNKGEYINIEMQKAYQENYFHRTLFYSSRFIGTQRFAGIRNGKPWDWNLKRTYHIGFLDFDFAPMDQLKGVCGDSWKIWCQLAYNGEKCEPKIQFSQKEAFSPALLDMCFISLPRFKATVIDSNTVKSSLEKYAWIFSNISSLTERELPEWAKDKIFKDVVLFLKKDKLEPDEMASYHAEVIARRNRGEEDQSLYRLAKEEGKKEGIEEGKMLLSALFFTLTLSSVSQLLHYVSLRLHCVTCWFHHSLFMLYSIHVFLSFLRL